MGGALSFAAAARIPGLAAVAPFYGIPGPQDWSKVTAPIQAHFARGDDGDWSAPAKAEEIGRQVAVPFELFVYEAEHAFMNEQRPEVYAPEHAALAWQRLVAFLRTHS